MTKDRKKLRLKEITHQQTYQLHSFICAKTV